MSHPLHLAVVAEDSPERIRRLLALGIDVDDLDEHGNTPLMLALSLNQNTYYFDPLIDAGASLTVTNKAAMSPLMVALDRCHPCYVDELLEWLRSAGVAPIVDVSVECGKFALLFAIYNNDEQQIHALVTGGADVNALHGDDRTPLMLAAEMGHAASVRSLLELGADQSPIDDHQVNALSLAAESGSAECIRLLLDAGSDPNQRNDFGYTPLIEAAFGGDAPEAVRTLLSYGADVHAAASDGSTALTQAAWMGNERTVHVLLEHGAGDDKVSLQGAYRACFTDNGHNCAPILLEAGATIGIREAIAMQDSRKVLQLLQSELVDAAGFGPTGGELLLDALWSHCDTRVIAALLERGANVNATSKSGKTAINLVANTGNEDTLILLLEAGAEVNNAPEFGHTPLMTYAWSGKEEAVRRLLQRGALVDAQDDYGQSALMLAVLNCQVAAVKQLLNAGANVELTDKTGKSALMHAVVEGCKYAVQLLLARGATLEHRDGAGVSALQLAQLWKYDDIADLLVCAGAQE